VVNTRLAVPTFDDDKLQASTMILADQLGAVASKDIGVGSFVIGSTKVRPKVSLSFSNDQTMAVFQQFYNLKVDDQTHKNNATVDTEVFQGQQSVEHLTQTSEQMHQTGDQLTLQQVVNLSSLMPGKYRLEVRATDGLAKQTVTHSTDFTVTEPEKTAATPGPAGK
jgi:hypothetical protein